MTSSGNTSPDSFSFEGDFDDVEEVVRVQRIRYMLSQDKLLKNYQGAPEQLANFIGSLVMRARLPAEEPLSDAKHDNRLGVDIDDQALRLLMPDVALHLSPEDISTLVDKTRGLLEDPDL